MNPTLIFLQMRFQYWLTMAGFHDRAGDALKRGHAMESAWHALDEAEAIVRDGKGTYSHGREAAFSPHSCDDSELDSLGVVVKCKRDADESLGSYRSRLIALWPKDT